MRPPDRENRTIARLIADTKSRFPHSLADRRRQKPVHPPAEFWCIDIVVYRIRRSGCVSDLNDSYLASIPEGNAREVANTEPHKNQGANEKSARRDHRDVRLSSHGVGAEASSAEH